MLYFYGLPFAVVLPLLLLAVFVVAIRTSSAAAVLYTSAAAAAIWQVVQVLLLYEQLRKTELCVPSCLRFFTALKTSAPLSNT